ncbi:anthranilate synthase component 2 [Peptoclostridium litorale DSM 5388]|uniref:Bifunctional protein TrpGD n=1 Tax=Peptoclostridium litorale DSM 5388 TaxID=1121324 RepID=A0A069RGC3_PEPLI|nr:aminodeoxychorismate/anthranilate synthase component II [Peptoclostridium litorale]KDR95858.1 bifunctional protein TrpGD [Peptoclostridium litorale DSM 5388]SIO11235.1 anthranilate synthase component 2 [Peptoclostridium litorale DSM 5388]
MILIIDNYDSFTYNLYQYIGEIDEDVKVFRNDEITLDDIEKMKPSSIIISPGPGYPVYAGISMAVIRRFGGKIPILGVCLGHQAIGEAFGGRIVHAKETKHGKATFIKHDGKGLFTGIESPAEVMRYHSLIVETASIGEELEVTARDDEGQIMGLRHREYPIYGVQFHPESIGTAYGKKMIENFIEISKMQT